MPKPTPIHFHHQSSAANNQSSGGTTTPTLTTSVYQTNHGIFSLTWSFSTFRRRSLHLTHLPSISPPPPLSLHLHISPFSFFFTNSGSKRLGPQTRVFWDFSRARFGSGPEPESGFYVAVVVGADVALISGDLVEEAFSKTKGQRGPNGQVMVLRREHVCGNKVYTTKAQFGRETKDISIDCRAGDDPRLCISFDHKRVLQVKHLKWKFRGNEQIEVDGVYIQISWDVYNWLFEDDDQEGYALFLFRFKKQFFENGNYNEGVSLSNFKNGLLFESQQSCGLGFEKKKMKKRILRSERSASSSSLSSASSCSSVMEWESVEENELKGSSDFSLLVYAWKS